MDKKEGMIDGHGCTVQKEGRIQRSLTRLVEAQWGEGEKRCMTCHTMPCNTTTTPCHIVPYRVDSTRFDSRQDKTRQDKTNNGARKEKGRGTDMKGIGGGRDEAGRQAGRHR
jgi:hypothetical protein